MLLTVKDDDSVMSNTTSPVPANTETPYDDGKQASIKRRSGCKAASNELSEPPDTA